jgi:hypothetical protein
MPYRDLFSKAWKLIWKHKFLVLLGILAVLGPAGTRDGGSQSLSSNLNHIRYQDPTQFDFNFSSPFQNLGIPVFAGIGLAILALLAFIVFLALWVLSTLARGGLIYGADRTSREVTTDFGNSFGAAWKKGWQLVVIGLVPAIPTVLLAVSALLGAGVYASGEMVFREGHFMRAPNAAILLPLLAFTFVLLLAALVLALLRNFAERACMLEDLGVIASYRRGLAVITKNLGPVLVLFLLQIAVSIVIGLVLLVPGIVIALCCLLWPVILLVQGGFAAFYSTLWTLAWNQWTGARLVSF